MTFQSINYTSWHREINAEFFTAYEYFINILTFLCFYGSISCRVIQGLISRSKQCCFEDDADLELSKFKKEGEVK